MNEELLDRSISNWSDYDPGDHQTIKKIIKNNINSVCANYVAIGYYLNVVSDRELYKEDGYSGIGEYAAAEYGIEEDKCSYLRKIANKFCIPNSPALFPEYRDFKIHKLREMVYLTDEQLEQVAITTTVAEIRKLKKPEHEKVAISQVEPEFKKPYYECAAYQHHQYSTGCKDCFYDKADCPYDRTGYFEKLKRKEEWRIHCEVLKEMCNSICKMSSYVLEKNNYSMETIRSLSRKDQDFSFGFGDDNAGHSKYSAWYKAKTNQYKVEEFHGAGKWTFEAGEVDQHIWNFNGRDWHDKHPKSEAKTILDRSSDCPPDIHQCIRQEWGTEPAEQERGKKECKKCWKDWDKLHKPADGIPESVSDEPEIVDNTPEIVTDVDKSVIETLADDIHEPIWIEHDDDDRDEDEERCKGCRWYDVSPDYVPDGKELPCFRCCEVTDMFESKEQEVIVKKIETAETEERMRFDFWEHKPVVMKCSNCNYDTMSPDVYLAGHPGVTEFPCNNCNDKLDRWEPKIDNHEKEPEEVETVEADIIQTEPEYNDDDEEEDEIIDPEKYSCWDVDTEIDKLTEYLEAFRKNNDTVPGRRKAKMRYDAIVLLDKEMRKKPAVVEEPEPDPVQPELPILKNNDQRAEWLRNYKDWGVWYKDEHIDVTYYKYDFSDGSYIVVDEYVSWDTYNRKERTSTFDHLVGKVFNSQGDKTRYSHYDTSNSELVEHLKYLQKK